MKPEEMSEAELAEAVLAHVQAQTSWLVRGVSLGDDTHLVSLETEWGRYDFVEVTTAEVISKP